MQRVLGLVCIFMVGSIGITGCGSSGTSDAGVLTDLSVTPTDAGAPADIGKAVTLTVMNFFDWCSVTVNGGAASTGAMVTAAVAPGSIATIVATPASSAFQIGTDPWFGVNQADGGAAPGTDVGSGATETSTATVTITSSKTTQCVSVCCQLPNNSPTPCPATNPCP